MGRTSPATDQEPKPKCDVCGEPAIGLGCSSTGAISFLYCAKCLEEDREPYWALVASTMGMKSIDQVAEWYRPVILSNLKAEGKTLEEFFADVEEAENTMTRTMEAEQISPVLPTSPPLAVHPERGQGDSCVLRRDWTRRKDSTNRAVHAAEPEGASEASGASSGSCCIRCHTPLISTYDEGLLVGQTCPTCYPPEQHSPTEENRQRRLKWRSGWKLRIRPKWRSR